MPAAFVGQIQVVHVRRGVDRAQDAIHVDSAGVGGHVQALRQHYLEGVAVGNRALGRVDRRLEVRALRTFTHRGGLLTAHAQDGGSDGRGQLSRHSVKTLDRTVVGAVDAFVGAVEVPGDRHQVHGAGRVVDGRDLRGQHERRVGNVRFLGRGGRQGRLPLGNDAPAQRTDECAGQRRQALNRRGGELLQGRVHDLQERALLTSTFRVGSHPAGATIACNDRTGTRGANEGPTPPGASVLRGLEDEAAVVAVSELTIDADRAQLISENSPNNRDHAPRRGKRDEHVTRWPRLTPFEADRLGLMRRRRNTHRVIVPSRTL